MPRVSAGLFLLSGNAAAAAVSNFHLSQSEECHASREGMDEHGLLQAVVSRSAAVEVVKDWQPFHSLDNAAVEVGLLGVKQPLDGLDDSVNDDVDIDLLDIDQDPSAARRAQIRTLGGMCGQGLSATLSSTTCPEECPLATRDLSSQSTDFCTFACVPATEAACVAYSPGEPIPDEALGVCRAPAVRGCMEYVAPAATMSASDMEKCLSCSKGYMLLADGSCESMYAYIWYGTFVIAGIWLACGVAWLMDLARRPLMNNAGLEHGLATRSRSKLHTPKDLSTEVTIDSKGKHQKHSVDSGRKLWPLTTNLCETMVAGPGLVLHFNFLAMLVVWSAVILVAWVVFAYVVDVDGDGALFKMGMRGAVTPAETCAVISWGHENQQKYIWAKTAFVAGCYVFSVAFFLLFGVRQLRLFQSLEERETTHSNYCIVLEGLPTMTGDEEVEVELCNEIEEAMGHRPVGVSIAWEIANCHEEIMNTIDESLDQLHEEEVASHGADKGVMQGSYARRATRAHMAKDAEELTRKLKGKKAAKRLSAAETAADKLKEGYKQVKRGIHELRSSPSCPRILQESESEESLFRRMTLGVERAFLTSTTQQVLSKGKRRDFGGRHVDADAVDPDFDIDDELATLKTCHVAFAVFETEEVRNEVLRAAKANGFSFRDNKVSMSEAKHEPDSVFWTNFNDEGYWMKVWRIFLGILTIIVALALWTVIFYLPYAYYYMSFNYGSGQWPGVLEEMTFVMIIVAGNATMYFLCSEVADKCGFQYIGDRELCYVLMYYVACTLNVILDMVCGYKVAYMALVGMGSRESDGTLLADISTFSGRFEAYPMQRDLGWTVFAYAFPCTFLLPFLAEPLFTMFLPYKVMTAIVGYRLDIQGCRADAFLACAPMDLSRYGDVALNAVLATLVFWFPSGLTISMFGFCMLSHIYIYVYDQYRVLRAVPACSFSCMRADTWGQAMLAVPCAMLLSCALYKGNCDGGLEKFLPADGVFGYCKQDEQSLVMKCFAAFALHIAIHVLVLLLVVPLFGSGSKEPSKTPYEECARRLPFSYFSANPVHCLRSEYVYEHDPPFVCCRSGKEHLMPQNKEIGAHFVDSSALCEDYSDSFEAFNALSGLASIFSTAQPHSPRKTNSKTKDQKKKGAASAKASSSKDPK